MIKKTILGITVLFYALNLSGCFLIIPAAICIVGGVGIGIGTAKWMSDKLVEQVPYPYQKTILGSKSGLGDLKINITKDTETDALTQISATYPDGRTVWVTVANVSKTVSRIEVRVGVWGGQPDARKILDAILGRLK